MLILLFLSSNTISHASSEVKVGFCSENIVLQPYARSFTLNITVFSGGSKIVAGEFNVSYPAEIRLVSVEGRENWTVTQVANRFVFYTLTTPKDTTVIASLNFNIEPTAAGKILNLKLEIFHAADANGNDLSTLIHPNKATIVLLEETSTIVGWNKQRIEKVGEEEVSTIKEGSSELGMTPLIISIIIASLILLASIYIRNRKSSHIHYNFVDGELGNRI